MMTLFAIQSLFSESIIDRLGWVLVHSLWQFAGLGLVAAILLRLMRHSSSTARYALLVFVIALAAAAPVATWLMQPANHSPISEHVVVNETAQKTIVADSIDSGNTPIAPAVDRADASKVAPIAANLTETKAIVSPAVMPAAVVEVSLRERINRGLEPWLGWIVGSWCAGVLLFSLRPLIGWRMLRRLRTIGISRPTAEVLAAFSHVAERLRLPRAVQVLHSTVAKSPMVIGYFRPVVLLPVSLLSNIPVSQLEAILAHELAHVRRHDFIINLVQTLIETLFFYHPAVWWLSHRIRIEREHCCDDLVVKLFNNKADYGRALIAVEQLQVRTTTLALGVNDGSLLARIRRIVGVKREHRNARLLDRWPTAIAFVLALSIAVPLAMLGAADDKPIENPKPAAMPTKPRDKEAQSLFAKYQSYARTDGKIPGALIGQVPTEVENFLKQSKDADKVAKLAAMLPRIDASRDWTQADLVTLFDDIEAISGAPIGWTDLRMEFAGMRNVRPGKPLPAELKTADWGKPATNGLRAAWLLEPRAKEYGLGAALKSRVLFHNTGKEPIVVKTETWHQHDLHSAQDVHGDEVKVDKIWFTGMTPTTIFLLAPDECGEVAGHGIAIGETASKEESSNVAVGAFIKAKAGDEVRLSHIVSTNDHSVTQDERDEFWKDAITRRIAREAPLPSAAADRDQLIKRVTLDVFGVAATTEEIAAFVSDNTADALEKLTTRLLAKPRPEMFSGKLPTGETKFRVAVAEAKAIQKLSGRLFVNAGLRTAKDEKRFVQSEIAIDPATGSWTELRNVSKKGFTVPLSPVRVSFDGRTMLFVRDKEIWKCDAMTGENAVRVFQKGLPKAWAPSGEEFVAIVENDADGMRKTENWMISFSDNSEEKQAIISLPEGDIVEDWSADGELLVGYSQVDNQLFTSKTNGNDRKLLTSSEKNATRNEHPRFSPDGRRVVYLQTQYEGDKGKNARFALRMINIDGTNDREILGEAKIDKATNDTWTAPMAARWSPDGKGLAVVLFDHQRDGGVLAINGNWRLAIIDADGSNLRELKLEGVMSTVLPWDGPEWRPAVAAKMPQQDIKLEAEKTKKLLWSAPVNGLRAAIAIRHANDKPNVDSKPELYLAVQNVSKAPLHLNDTKAAQARRLTLRINGKTMFRLIAKNSTLSDVVLKENEIAYMRMLSGTKDKDGRTEEFVFADEATKNPNQTFIAELNIDSAPEGAWTGKIKTVETSAAAAKMDSPEPQKVSDEPAAPVSSVGEKLKPGMAENLKWGEPVNGLRGAVVIRHPNDKQQPGDRPSLYLVLQNVSSEPIRLSDADVPANVNLRELYLRIDGRLVSILGAREPALGDVILNPQEATYQFMFGVGKQKDDKPTLSMVVAEGAMKDTHQSLSVLMTIEKAPAGAWTGKLKTGDATGAVAAGQPQPKNKKAQALLAEWQHHARANGDFPGGHIGHLGEKVNKFIKLNTGDASGDAYAKKMQSLVSRFDASRDWKPDELVALLDDIAAITTIPLDLALEQIAESTVHRGMPLPKSLAAAPWGEKEPNGLRMAWLLEPREAECHLGTPLKSRVLIHNAGKDSVVFRTRGWHQARHKAHDAAGIEIKVNSILWTTRGTLATHRLAPGEFVELWGAGIGVGQRNDANDWQNARVGTWIDAQAGDDVVVTTNPIMLRDDIVVASNPNWWPDFITEHLTQDLPLPADKQERERLAYRAGMELFGTPVSTEMIAAFAADRETNALLSFAKHLAERKGLVSFDNRLTSGPTKFRVLPADPDAAKKVRTAHSPGYYTLGEHVRLSVATSFDDDSVVHDASLLFFSADPKKPGQVTEPYKFWLPSGLDTWALAWQPDVDVLWVQQKGLIRSFDFTNRTEVKETTFEKLKNVDKVPKEILDALRTTLPAPAGPQSAPPASSK